MHPLLGLAIVIVVIAVLITISSNITSKRQRLERIKANFGKPPEDDGALYLQSAIRYFQYMQTENPSDQRVDDITWNDLDMDKVFMRINSCATSVGEEYLYAILHDLPLNSDSLDKREKLIQFFKENPDARLAVQAVLSNKLGKENFNGLTSLMFAPSNKLLSHRYVYAALALMPVLMGFVIFLNVAIGIIGIIAAFIINMFIHYRTKQQIATELPSIKYLNSLLRCCKALLRNNKLEGLPFIDEIGKHYKSIKSIKKNLLSTSSTLGDTADSFFEYYRIMFLSDIRHYNKFMRTIRARSREFIALYKAIGEIDISVAVLSFRLSLPVFCVPEFISDASLEFTDIFHPLIAKPVTNSVDITNDSLLTGSNASGKSTFIKSLAINGILAQTINTCAAASFKTRFSLVMTSMVVRDDLSAGDSYFIVEIKSLQRILELVKNFPCTCYIDEILRGTNTIERIAASAAVLEYLHKQDALCIAASHDIELTRILAGQYDNYHFRETVTDGGVTFDYKINSGPSTTRNAIKLLEFMGFPREIVDQANALADDIK